jgi:bacterioferritin-associated ferredoxin
MIVCICRAVSDRTIRAARAEGAQTVEAIAVATGAGTGCGCCRGTIAKILAEPCRPVPCAGCPARPAASADATESVPVRVAAGGRDAP